MRLEHGVWGWFGKGGAVLLCASSNLLAVNENFSMQHKIIAE